VNAVATEARTPAPELRVTQLRVLRSEWTKLWSLRSTRWSLAITVAMTIGFACLAAFVNANRWSHMSPDEQAHRSPLTIAQIGVDIAQLVLGILGVLIISGEYSTGMIRATLGAVPKRLPVLWAKALVFGFVAFAVSLPAVLIAWFGSQAILNTKHILQLSFSAHGVSRVVIGGALYLTVVGVFGFALGAILRNTAAGIAAFAIILFVIPPLMNVLPTNWQNAANPYLPSNAGRAILNLTHGSDSLAPWPGFGLFVAYTAVALAVAAFLLVRRDA
jgi:ABC-type transport system involved in multi-copper enzyme maturation permease subunit